MLSGVYIIQRIIIPIATVNAADPVSKKGNLN